MTAQSYNPATAQRLFRPNRAATRDARVHANEALLHDLQNLGWVDFFEGPGDNPTSLTGYASNKLWLRQSSGVQETAGTVRVWDGVGATNLLASWPVIDANAWRGYLSPSLLAGFLQSGTGAVTRTWQDKARDAVSVLDFIPTTLHAAIKAGTSTDPVASYINAALAAHTAVWCPFGRYYIGEGEQVTPPSGARLYGPGKLGKYSTATARTDNLVVLNNATDVVIDGLGLVKITGNHFAIHIKGTSGDIRVRNCRIDTLLSFVEEGATDVSFRNNRFSLGTTAQGAVATGGAVNTSTGIGARGNGRMNGFVFEGNYVTGCSTEVIDINWNTQNFIISNNIFDNCGLTSGNELIDIGGAGLTGASITAGGTGYVTGDVVTMDGGTTNSGLKATFTVTATAGVVTALTMTDGGYYLIYPSGTTGVATTASTGAGTGLTIAPVYGYCGHGKVTNNVFLMASGVEKRAIRVKWNCRDIDITGNTVIRPSMPGSESTVQSDFLSIEQSDDIRVSSNSVRNMQQGVSIDGPAKGVKISRNNFFNIRRNCLAAGSGFTLVADVDGLEWVDNHVEMPNILSADEAIDLAYCKNYTLSGGTIRLPTGITEDHIEIRSTSTGRGTIKGMHLYGGRYGVLTSAGVGPLSIESNHVEMTGREAFYLVGTDDVSLLNNDCNDNGNDASVYAITLDSCDDVLLMGNKIRAQVRGVRVLTDGARHRWIGNDIDAATPFLNLNLLTLPTIESNITQGAVATGAAVVATDAAFTLTPFVSAPRQIHTGTLTADRTITLSTTNAVVGMSFRVTRTGAGAFNLSVGGLKNLTTSTWAEVTYNGSAWVLTQYGAL